MLIPSKFSMETEGKFKKEGLKKCSHTLYMMYYKVILWIDVNCIESKTLQE